MEEDIDEKECKEVASQNSKMAAKDAVFGTYELLEAIILELPTLGIIDMALVNKACYDVVSSDKLRKNVMLSGWFHGSTYARRRSGWLHESNGKTHWSRCGTQFGPISVLRLHDKELVAVKFESTLSMWDKPTAPPFEPVLFTSDQEIPGLTSSDRALLGWGWVEALQRWEGSVYEDKYRTEEWHGWVSQREFRKQQWRKSVGERRSMRRITGEPDPEFIKRLEDGIYKLARDGLV